MLINKDFVCHGIRVTIALPESYDATKTYPAVFLNDGQLDYLGKLANSVILIGLEPKNRLDDFTPWQAQALRAGSPDFGGKLASYHCFLNHFVLLILALFLLVLSPQQDLNLHKTCLLFLLPSSSLPKPTFFKSIVSYIFISSK